MVGSRRHGVKKPMPLLHVGSLSGCCTQVAHTSCGPSKFCAPSQVGGCGGCCPPMAQASVGQSATAPVQLGRVSPNPSLSGLVLTRSIASTRSKAGKK